MAAKEVRRDINEEAIQAQAMELARAIFVQPTRWHDPLKQIGIDLKKDEALGVATIASVQLELELANVPIEQRRKIATTITGRIIDGRLGSIFPIGSSVTLQRTEIDDIELYHRSDIKPQSAQARYTAYKELLDAKIAEKRRPTQQRRETKEERDRKRRKEERSVRQAERKKPPLAVLKFLSYSSGTPENDLQSRITSIEEAFQKDKKNSVVVKQVSDPTRGFEDKSARLLAPEMIDRILEKGLTPEQLERMVAVAREKLVDKLRNIEAYADGAAMQILADVGGAIETAHSKDFLIPITTQRSIAPLLYASLYYFNGVNSPNFNNETNFVLEADFGPNYPYLSYVNGLMHRWALRFASQTLEVHKELLENSQEPEAAFLLKVLDHNNHDDIIALKQGGAIEVEGKSIRLADLDAFLAPMILDDALLVHTIFADVLGALFPLPYTLNGDRREIGLISISKLAQAFATEEIPQLLAPDQEDPLSQQDIAGELKNQIEALENEVKNMRGIGREASLRKNALNKKIKDLYGSLRRITTAGGKKETRGEKIKRLLRERIPEKEPKPNSDENFLYHIFRGLSNSPKTEFMNRDSLIPSWQ